MIARNFSSDNRELAVLPGAIIFFSLKFATATGSKSAKTSLQNEICWWVTYSRKVFESRPLLQKSKCIIAASSKIFCRWIQIETTQKTIYLKMCLLLRMAGHASSDKAPERTRSSNNFLCVVKTIKQTDCQSF